VEHYAAAVVWRVLGGRTMEGGGHGLEGELDEEREEQKK
jgi:hypothetical protein